MNTTIYSRLSLMMFLEYFIWGSWYVTMGTFLGTTLEFNGTQIGAAYGAGAIAAIISPFFVGLIADRFFATERVLAVMHLLGAGLMYMASQATSFGAFYPMLLGYTLAYFPTIALTNAICFHQMQDPESQFPRIRVWGTIGWIVAGLVILFIQSAVKLGFSADFPFIIQATQIRDIESTSIPLQIAAGVSILMAIYSLSLPHTPPKDKGKKMSIQEILGLDAIGLLRDRSFLVLFVASILICIPLMFYYSFTNLFLNEIVTSDGIKFTNAAGKMSLGQLSELFFMLVMPFFFKRLGVKWMILVGMLAWVARYLLFALGDPGGLVWMLYLGIILHGICYDFFFVTGQIYADNKAPDNLRSSVQGMMTFATYGVGFFIGSIISGMVVDAYTAGSGHNWEQIWYVPAGLALVVFLFFLIFFKDNKTKVERV